MTPPRSQITVDNLCLVISIILRWVNFYDHYRSDCRSCDNPERVVCCNQIVSDTHLHVRVEDESHLECFCGEFKTGTDFEFTGRLIAFDMHSGPVFIAGCSGETVGTVLSPAPCQLRSPNGSLSDRSCSV